MTGLGEGIESKDSWLGSRLKSFASGVVDTLKGAFGIHSPSRVLADEIGAFMPAGIGEGFNENIGDALLPFEGLRKRIIDSVDMPELALDVNSRLEDHVQNMYGAGSQWDLLGGVMDTMTALADRPINLMVDGYHFAIATASSTDAVSGNRLNLSERGLSLD